MGKLAEAIEVVSILRAGLGIRAGFTDFIPVAKMSIVGLYRNEDTLEPVLCHSKLARDVESREASSLDIMLAIGGKCSGSNIFIVRGF